MVCDEAIQWERIDGDLGLRKHVEHVKLIGHGALLTNGKHLEPTQTLSLFNDGDKVVPFFAGQRLFNIDLKALEVGLMLGLTLLLLRLVFDRGALRLMLSDEIRLGSGFEPLPQREISVDNQFAVSLLILLSRSEDEHLAWDLWVGMRSQEVLGRQFIN